MDMPEHNALAALPPFVMNILSLTGLFSDGLLPHGEIYVTSVGARSIAGTQSRDAPNQQRNESE